VFGTTVARVGRDALFLTHQPIAFLPWAFALGAAAWLIVGALRERRATDQTDAGLLDSALYSAIACSLLCCVLCVLSRRVAPCAWIVYVAVEAASALALMSAWDFAGRFLAGPRPRSQANLGLFLGTAAGGLAAFALISSFGLPGLFLCWTGSLGAALLLLGFLTDDEGESESAEGRALVVTADPSRSGNPLTPGPAAVGAALAICGCFAAGGVWIEFEFLRRGAQWLERDAATLGQFLGAVVALAAVLTISLQLLIDGRTRPSWGGRVFGGARAALLAVIGLASALFHGLWLGAGARALWGSAGTVLESPMCRRLADLLSRQEQENFGRLRIRYLPAFVAGASVCLGIVFPVVPVSVIGLGVVLLAAASLVLLWAPRSHRVGEIFPALSSEDEEMRSRALNHLLGLPDSAALAAIARAADTANADVKLSLLDALVERNGIIAKAVACGFASDSDAKVRGAAVSFLSWAGTEKKLPVLLERLSDESASVCTSAAIGCARLLGERAVGPLARLQSHADPRVRLARQLALAKYAGPAGQTSARGFRETLLRGTPDESRLCLFLLAQVRCDEFLGDLLVIARDSERSPAVRESSLRLLAAWGREEAVEVLLDISRQWPGNAAAISILKELLPRYPMVLAERLGVDDEPGHIRLVLLEAVRPPASDEIMNRCRECCDDERPDVRYAAVRALRRLNCTRQARKGAADWEGILQRELDRGYTWAESLAVLEGGPDKLEGLRSVLEDEFDSSREIVVDALGGLMGGNGSGAQFLKAEELGHPLSSDRRAALDGRCDAGLVKRLVRLLEATSPRQALNGAAPGSRDNGRSPDAEPVTGWTAALNRLRFAPAPPLVHIAANQALQEVISATQAPDPHQGEPVPGNRTLETVLLLKRVRGLERLHIEDLELLAGLADHEEMETGEVFVREGELLDGLAVVQRGGLTNCRQSNGHLDRLGSVGPGERLGEGCLSDDGRSAFTAVAETHTELLTLDREALNRAITLRPTMRGVLNGR